MPACYMALEKVPYVVQWYLTVAVGRETNLSQKAEKRSGYGIFRKIVGIRDFWLEGGGGREIKEIWDIF